MNEFVNFNQRGIELPPGCKDLIDVLPPLGTARMPAEGLSQIERHVSRLLQSPTKLRSLWINLGSLAIPVRLGLVHTKGLLYALIFSNKEQAGLIRMTLEEEEIPLIQDEPEAGKGPLTHFISCTLPVEPAEAARTVSDLFRRGYGLPEDVKLEFRYREMTQNK